MRLKTKPTTRVLKVTLCRAFLYLIQFTWERGGRWWELRREDRPTGRRGWEVRREGGGQTHGKERVGGKEGGRRTDPREGEGGR